MIRKIHASWQTAIRTIHRLPYETFTGNLLFLLSVIIGIYGVDNTLSEGDGLGFAIAVGIVLVCIYGSMIFIAEWLLGYHRDSDANEQSDAEQQSEVIDPAPADSEPISNEKPTRSLSLGQRAIYWIVALVVYFMVLAASPDMALLTTPAESAGAGVGVLLIWLLLYPTVKRNYGSAEPK